MQKIVFISVLAILYCSGFGDGLSHWSQIIHDILPGKIEDTTFHLYTRNNSKEGVMLPMGDVGKLLASGFNSSLPTKLVTHGHMDKAQSGWVLSMRDALLEKEEMNVILVDWSWCAKKILYETSVACAKDTGEYVGKFLLFLQSKGNMDINMAHLIGHSLGAQLMGFAARAFPKEKTIGRISGLDPAGPLYEHVNETERLNPRNAKIVDVIHTCRLFTGMVKPVGTIDFYPNGGYFQPGCEPLNLGCHHKAAHQYFTKSIKDVNRYIGTQCDTHKDAFKGMCSGPKAVMGYNADQSPLGIYYINMTAPSY